MLGFFLPILVYIFVGAMCGGVAADVRSDFAVLPLYGVRLVTDTLCLSCTGCCSVVVVSTPHLGNATLLWLRKDVSLSLLV